MLRGSPPISLCKPMVSSLSDWQHSTYTYHVLCFILRPAEKIIFIWSSKVKFTTISADSGVTRGARGASCSGAPAPGGQEMVKKKKICLKMRHHKNFSSKIHPLNFFSRLSRTYSLYHFFKGGGGRKFLSLPRAPNTLGIQAEPLLCH